MITFSSCSFSRQSSCFATHLHPSVDSMMNHLRRLAKPLFRASPRRNLESAISRLRSDEGAPRLLGDALQETLQNRVTPDERMWIRRIELLREQLNSSTREISIEVCGVEKLSPTRTNEARDTGEVLLRTIGEVCRSASTTYFWSLLLFKLVRKLRPSFCLELGTCLGISASFQAAALKLNGMGRLVTLEGARTLTSLAEGNFQALGLDNVRIVLGRFQDTLDKVLQANESVDYAFIDGHHDEQATVAYYKQIACFLSEKALLVFDDISWSDGMKRAWRAILADERVKTSVNLGRFGVCVVDAQIENKKDLVIPGIRKYLATHSISAPTKAGEGRSSRL